MFLPRNLTLDMGHGKRLQRKGHPQKILWTVTANGRKYTLTKFCKLLGIPYLSVRQSVLLRGVDGFKQFPEIVATAMKRAQRAASATKCPTCGKAGYHPPEPTAAELIQSIGGENL